MLNASLSVLVAILPVYNVPCSVLYHVTLVPIPLYCIGALAYRQHVRHVNCFIANMGFPSNLDRFTPSCQ